MNILRYFVVIVRDFHRLLSALRAFWQVVLRATTAVVWTVLDPSLLDTSAYIEWSLESVYGSLTLNTLSSAYSLHSLISRFFLNLRFACYGTRLSTGGQSMAAFALDNISPTAVETWGLSRRRQRTEVMTDIYLDMNVESRAPERVDRSEIEWCDEQTDAG